MKASLAFPSHPPATKEDSGHNKRNKYYRKLNFCSSFHLEKFCEYSHIFVKKQPKKLEILCYNNI